VEQEARIADLRQAAAAAASSGAEKAARVEQSTAVMQAQIRDLQATLAQKAAETQQSHAQLEV
jgi:hypothetical protein